MLAGEPYLFFPAFNLFTFHNVINKVVYYMYHIHMCCEKQRT